MVDSIEDRNQIIRYRRIAQLPWGVHFLDEIQLLSPLTWRGAAIIGKVKWEWIALFQSAAAIMIIPIVCYMPGWKEDRGTARQVFQHYPAVATGLYSIWSLAWFWKGTTGIRAVLYKTFLFSRWPEMLGLKSTRSPATVEAWRVLSERMTQQRAYRTRRYDAYLPPYLQPSRAVEAILFLPGFGVDHVAYAESAARLSDAGFVVVVLSAEPLRVASTELGFASAKIKDIQYNVCRRLDVPLSWSAMGHSLGSFTATHVSLQFDIPRVVMWGSAPMDDLIADLSTSNKRVLIIQGANDKVIEFMVPDEEDRRKQTEKFYNKLPKETTTKLIQGGNHSGFGNYTPAFSIESPGMSRSEQHSQAVALTVAFLRNV